MKGRVEGFDDEWRARKRVQGKKKSSIKEGRLSFAASCRSDGGIVVEDEEEWRGREAGLPE